MNRKIRCAFGLDMAGAACLTAGMVYFFIYATVIFPDIAFSYTSEGQSVAATMIGAFGSALAMGIVMLLLAMISAAGIIAGLYAVFVSLLCRRILSRGGYRANRKKYLGLQISSAVLQAAACAAAICFATLYAEYIPVILLSVFCLAFLCAGLVYKMKNFKQDKDNPQ